MKSVCEERLSLVNTANTEPGPENIVNGQPSASISQTADAELTKLDIETDQVTRKYFEVLFCEVLLSQHKRIFWTIKYRVRMCS